MIHQASSYGAAGNGQTDDTVALQTAIDAAAGEVLELDQGPYLISAPLVVSMKIAIRGGLGSTIKASAPMREMVRIACSGGRMSEVHLDANFAADFCVLMHGCSNWVFESVSGHEAKVDGVHHAAENDAGSYAINDRNMWLNPSFSRCGTLHRTAGLTGEYRARVLVQQIVTAPGTVDTVGNVATFSDFDPSFLRPGDPIRVGDEYRVITASTASTVTVARAFDEAHVGADFAAGHGDGWHEEKHGDNNIHALFGGLFRSNAGYQLAFAGLYGPRVYGVQIDSCPFWGVRLGESSSVAHLGTILDGIYFEGDAMAGANIMIAGNAQNFAIRCPIESTGTSTPSDEIDLSVGVHQAQGVYLGKLGIFPVGQPYGARSHLGSTLLSNAYARGVTTEFSAQLNEGSGTPGHTFDQSQPVDTYKSNTVYLGISSPNGATLTGSPAIVLVAGKTLRLVNRGPGPLHLRDDSGTGSRLFLRGRADRTLAPYEGLTVTCDGYRWIEV
jgi:hypothetical protein